MYFLNTSFFTGDIFIPNLEQNCVQNVEFYKLMSKWEKEGLELSLGKCLADELLSQFEIVDGEGVVIGIVTSGTQSPVLEKGIGMGYINEEFSTIGSEIFILVRNKRLKAKVVHTPFIQG